MRQQLNYFRQDLRRIVGKRKSRIWYTWSSRVFWGVGLYRFERGMYQLIGEPYKYLRIVFILIFNLILAYSNIELNYKSDIKGGLLIYHCSNGTVISGLAVIGENFTLTGGNIIGAKRGCKSGDIQIGDNVSLGANAVIIGPIKLGNDIQIGACACAMEDCLVDHSVLVGVPAKTVTRPG